MKKARRKTSCSDGPPQRILARILAEDLRSIRAGLEVIVAASTTVTDLGERRDATFRGGDGDAS